MKMAKASEKDIDAAAELHQILELIDERFGGPHSINGVSDSLSDELGDDDFDSDDERHLQALYNNLAKLLRTQPNFHGRVIGGMCYVIMYDKNEIIDPDSDCLDLHPRFSEAFDDLQRETQAARYWNMRYHKMVEENNQLRSIVSACAGAVGAHCDKSASTEFMNSVATEVYLFVDKLRYKYQREHIDTNRWKNRAELAEARIELANQQEPIYQAKTVGGLWSDVTAENYAKHAIWRIVYARPIPTQSHDVEREELIRLIEAVRKWGIDHTGCEPSISCFHQAVDNLRMALDNPPAIPAPTKSNEANHA